MLRLSRIIAISYIAICLLALALTALFGPLGYAPFPLIPARARPPIVVTLWYSTEKREWLEASKAAFEQTNPTYGGRPIQVELKGLGSPEIAQRVAREDWRGETPPTAISPASDIWLTMLNVPVSEAPQPLVLSPLVVVGWADRAKVLWPNGPKNFWHDLHDALVNQGGWKALGGSESWGPVKFGHTSPLTSNSGAQTLILLAYAFHSKSSGLTTADINDPGFITWLQGIEGSVASFGDSTGTFMNDIVTKGPSQYDFGVVYENLALQNMDAAQQRQGQPLRIYYPPATLLSDHPFAALDGAWIKPEQRAAALVFRDFLRSNTSQKLALRYGFRPVDPNVAITVDEDGNPFKKYAPNGVQIDIASQAETPSAQVLGGLLEMWKNQVKR
ncbi:MAG TPA: substrate-binding domain-containing protein [Roseiflexaceae bacterium]|nr:substrate-binding domain-containing protein [Roseiflexaceae bacterium]